MKDIKLVKWVALLAVGILAILYFAEVRTTHELRSKLDSKEQVATFIKTLSTLNQVNMLRHCLTYKTGGEQGEVLIKAQLECALSMTARSAGQLVLDYTSRYGQPIGVDWSEYVAMLIEDLQAEEPDMATALKSCLKK